METETGESLEGVHKRQRGERQTDKQADRHAG